MNNIYKLTNFIIAPVRVIYDKVAYKIHKYNSPNIVEYNKDEVVDDDDQLKDYVNIDNYQNESENKRLFPELVVHLMPHLIIHLHNSM